VLSTLIDRAAGEALPLPDGLRSRYGGDLRIAERCTFANFVSTIDGVVSFAAPGEDRARHVSRGDTNDRFVLALLRAAADAVVVGAGTLRKEPDSVWTAESVFPDAASDFAALRAAMRKPPAPLTVVVSASGETDLGLPAFAKGGPVVIATTETGARRITHTPAHVTVRVFGGAPQLRMEDVVRAAIELAGGARILTEGGANILGQFLAEGVLDELFLTVAPRLAGRTRDVARVALVEGASFKAADAPEARLASLKLGGDYLFSRYAFAAR
jgi:riboflavin biosynthesis pyrimidine reductase